jgi:glycosyltransferase involved in cell wall biosynthesis
MRILFVTQYYPPETGACPNRLESLARSLHESGHDVTVLTAMPNYPCGRVYDDYRGRLTCMEVRHSIRVIRTAVYPSISRRFLPRLLSYLSFTFSAVALGAWRVPRPDVVITESPPLFLGFSGLVLSWLSGARHVLNVSDLWPESAIALGMLRNNGLATLATALEEFLYRHSEIMTGQTRGIVKSISHRFPHKTVHLLPNGVDSAARCDATLQRRRVRQQFGLAEDAFVVGYMGLHGLMQGLDAVVGAARLLANEQQIVFALFGDGPEKPRLMDIAQSEGLRNLRFFPTQPEADVAGLMAAVDTSLVTLKRAELCRGALPSKLFASMGAGVAVIAAVKGEARELVERAGAGVVVEPEDAAGVAAAIRRLYRAPQLRRELGAHGRAFVHEHYDRKRIAREFEELLCRRAPAATAALENA